MERNLESSASDEANFDAMFSGVSLQSFLTLNTTQTSATTTSTFPALNLNRSASAAHLGESSSLNYAGSVSEFKLPKTEPFYYPSDGFLETESTQPFNFLSIPIPNHSVLTNSSSSTSSSSSPFHHLPDLHSLELTRAQQVQVQLYRPLLPEFPSKRVRVESATHSQETLDSIVQSCRVMPVPQSKLARRRRQKLSEKTQSLQRLMPWDTKMDMATMMDEAHKYITFLQAQLKALQTMPPSSSSSSSSSSANLEFGGLERLTRNQVLRVLVNSRVAQTVLYSKGRCVVSVEQLDLLQKLIFQQRQQQQLVLAPSSSRLFFNH